MRYNTRTASLIIPFGLATLAGCFSLGRDAPRVQHYVLAGALPTERATPPLGLAGLTIGMRRLDLAPYLATPAIVVRRGTNQIVYSDFHRWSEDPHVGINRAVAGYLAADTLVRAVDVAPWPVRSQYDFLVQLRVARFEGVAPALVPGIEGEAHLFASWEIIRQHDGAVLARGVTDYREPGWRVDDHVALVHLLDRGLKALAHDLVACLESLQRAGTC